MGVAVITGSTEVRGLMPRLTHQLALADIPFIVEAQPKYTNPVGRTLGMFVETLERLLARTGQYKYLVMIDAWDILFYGTKEELIVRIPEEGILIGAERNCWPDAYLAPAYKSKSPWRYANTGTVAGTRANLLDFVERIKARSSYHPDYIDQQWFNHRVLEGWPAVSLDTETRLVYCMIMERGTLDFSGGTLFNPLTKSKPLFLHFNGNSGQSLWPHIEKASSAGIRAGLIDEFNGMPGARNISVAVARSEDRPRLEALIQ